MSGNYNEGKAHLVKEDCSGFQDDNTTYKLSLVNADDIVLFRLLLKVTQPVGSAHGGL